MANRLRLDFNLKYSDERAAFVQKYLSQAEFKRWPPTPEECETIGNYKVSSVPVNVALVPSVMLVASMSR